MKSRIILMHITLIIFSFAFTGFTKPTLYLCKHIQFIPDSSYSDYYNNLLLDTLKKYLSQNFEIDSSTAVDENVLIQINSGDQKSLNFDIASTAHCTAKYFLCVEAKMKVEFRTNEDKNFTIPLPFPGGGVSITHFTITDENPEYHYCADMAFSFYRTSDGKKVKYWEDQKTSQNDSLNCLECVGDNISDMSEDIYKHLNEKNPFTIFVGVNTGLLFPDQLYGYELKGDNKFGSDFGISAKILLRNFGIDLTYSYLSFPQIKFLSNSFSVGPCFGYKNYTTGPLFSFIYTNGFLGITSFWGTSKEERFEDDYYWSPVTDLNVRIKCSPLVAMTGKVGVLMCFKAIPMSIEPNFRIFARDGRKDEVILAFNFGLRIGYTWELKTLR